MGSLSRVSSFASPSPTEILISGMEAHFRRLCGGSLAEDYNLQQLYRKPFLDVWKEEKDNRVFGPLSERMGVRGPGGELLMNDDEKEAAGKCHCLSCPSVSWREADSIGLGFYHAFCFYKV